MWITTGLWGEVYLRASYARLSIQRGGIALWWDVQPLPTTAYVVRPIGPFFQAPLLIEHGSGGVRGVLAPFWAFLIPMTGALFIIRRGQHASEPWACAECGYDLHGNESGRCSECGTAIQILSDPSDTIA